ncbi:MAG: hypothetical protein NC307_02960 [Roseburia sp.]|nr:hypothetical protein [Roseburia sp.]
MGKNILQDQWNEYGHAGWFRFFIFGFILICLVTVIKLPTAYYHREYGRSDLLCEEGKSKKYFLKRAQYVDEELSFGAGLFVTCPAVSLDKGEYRITIRYSADSEGNYISFQTRIKDAIKCKERYVLPKSEGEDWSAEEISICLNEYTEGIDINMYYGGKGKLEIFDMAVDGQEYCPCDILAIAFFVLFFYILGMVVLKRRGRKKFTVFAQLLLAAIASSYPYFANVLYGGDDLQFHLMRIVGIRDGLLAGQFPVRVYPSAYYGAGYGCGLYYPDLFLYFPAVLCLCGVSLAVSLQIFGFCIHLLAALIMFYAAKKMGGDDTVGVLCAIVYVFCEYFACNFYYRADLGECVAMCFFPLVICGFYVAVFQERAEWRPLSIAMTGLVLSHILSTLFAVVLLVWFSLIFTRKVFKKDAFLALCKAAVASFGLCAWFLVPFFEMYEGREYTNIASMIVDAQNYAIEFGELFVAVNREDPRTLGMILTLGAVLCFCVLYDKNICQDPHRKKMILALWCAACGIGVCATKIFPWDLFMQSDIFHDVAGLLQFPWRFLGPASAFLALGTGFAAVEVGKGIPKKTLIVSGFVISFILFIGICDYTKTAYIYHGDAIPETYMASDYLLQSTDVEALKNMEPKISESGITLFKYQQDMGSVGMKVSARSGSYIDTTLLYFKGYQAWDKSGNVLRCGLGENNRLRIWFPADYTGDVKVGYTGVPLWHIFDMISLFSLILWIFTWVYEKKRIRGRQ